MSLPFPERELHGIPDNLKTHKKCERWLKKHPNVHFPPPRSSWAHGENRTSTQ
jgi:hypothetical protein